MINAIFILATLPFMPTTLPFDSLPTIQWVSVPAAPVLPSRSTPRVSVPPVTSPKRMKPQPKRSLPAPKNAKLEPWKAEIAAYICTKSWDCRTAVAVAYAESGLNCGAKSPTNDHGVMQLHGQAIYDCRANIDRAYEMYKRRGWQPWSAYKNGKYKKFLFVYFQLK